MARATIDSMPMTHALNAPAAVADVSDVIAVSVLSSIRQRCSLSIREGVHELVARSAADLTDEFYRVMLEDEQASTFLSHHHVQTRLRHSMQRWLQQTFTEVGDGDLSAMVARQTQVGAMHARIRLPPQLMSMGTHVLVGGIRARLESCGLSGDALRDSQLYATDLMHLADGLMLRAYVRDVQREARADEAYRNVAMRHNASLERERQRAVLSEWVNELLFSMRPGRRSRLQRLRQSEFGHWYDHKARVLFEGAPDLSSVTEVATEIDEVLLPQFEVSLHDGSDDALFDLLRSKVDFIRYLLNDLFDRLGSLEQGRDAVTGLLGRRHLPAVMARELRQHQGGQRPFGVLVVRVDQFDFAHPSDETQHMLLQQLATLLQSTARAADHVFRYGSADFLLVAVEMSREAFGDLAGALRQRVFAHRFLLSGNESTRMTVSVGAALYDGHPDYQQVIRQAEQALIQAVAEGGNRCVISA